MKVLTITVMILAALSDARAIDVCCSEVGCFPSGGPWMRFPHVKCPDWIDPIFGLYTQTNNDTAEFFNRTSIPSDFSSSRRTIFVVHGYNSDYNKTFMHDIKNAVLEKDDVNVILVGWGKGALEQYPFAAANTRSMGAELALITNKLRGATGATNFWCVGWSLGAHVCGLAGLRTYFDRVTAIDPAGPLFDGFSPMTRVNPQSADFVDVIHTDGAGSYYVHYGMMTPVGHADYYSNGGAGQPGCPQPPPPPEEDEAQYGELDYWGCNHARAPALFIESIKNQNCLRAEQKCTDYNSLPYSCRACEGAECGIMGYAAVDTPATRGIFYLKTMDEQPYCQESGSPPTLRGSLFAILPLLVAALLNRL